ncbi:hypothetical protein TVAG_495050 [Trichomonas vaginalis G3]|uniref:Uncharacterized protein n=1 Tax=Trichomonas vaginalis (strain ATCC PRA-98 / G3) TaxID=412133 RepID=A2FWP0_TRIV3|nr:microtubule anchoring [Trichomonas vaginalis G3]EAX90668.1 hypothetical protein TVAG_495050 [Trichomonas vaginalis G3]KAI5553992.1 microtubule anchoring [Trichomonas vaginalis G3]|eukprot:XP_001303598.1 hypothetical protein [Trichomonas vaginalis G3]
MSTKGISDQAVDRLEESGYLMNVRSEMKAEIMKCLVEMENQGELPPHLRIKRFTPTTDEDANALAYIAEFMKFHGLEHSLECLKAETNGEILQIRSGSNMSELATAIASHDASGNGPNPLLADYK